MSLQKTEMRVAGVVEDRRRRVLIARLPAGHRSAGRWEFPSGPFIVGKSPEAAIREALNRTVGLQVDIEIGQPPFRYEYGDQVVTYRFFFCTVTGGNANPLMYDEVRWIERGQLREYEFEPAANEVANWMLES